jgi:hypothetical protein
MPGTKHIVAAQSPSGWNAIVMEIELAVLLSVSDGDDW